MDIYKLNQHQTPITEELRKTITKEVWEDFLDVLGSIKFIQNLIAPEDIRGFVKDRPKDSSGKVIVDLANPHLLEDMDYFRERALFFEKNKCYTFLRPNPNPRSEYAKFWAEEKRRWVEGLVRPDGEWVPGYYYFYLNYSPIWINENKDKGNKKSKKKASREMKFPAVWLGDYMFFHYFDQAIENGQHAKILKCRGVGFSFKTAAISPCNMYTRYGLPNFHLAIDKRYLDGKDGLFDKVLHTLDWIAENTPMPKLRLIDRPGDYTIQIGHRNEYGNRKGILSSVTCISLKDDPEKARGLRGPLIHYEEDGQFKDLESAWNVNRDSVEDGGLIFGTQFAGGTAGLKAANFEGSEKLFRNPKAYNIYGVPNVFDKNSDGSVECGFFWPSYLNRSECYDKINGEPDVIKALLELLEDRHVIKYNSSDPLAITQRKAEKPITPAEAVMRTEGTIFPVSDLKEYLADIKMQGVKFYQTHYVGELVSIGDKVEWQIREDFYPLRAYQTSGGNLDGAVEIFEMPKTGADNLPIKGRYCLGADVYDDDSGTSLGSIFVFDMFTDTIVAEYSGRPKFANDFYEICRRLCVFYNGELLYENNKKGLYTYFSHKNCLYLLSGNPEILKDTDMMRKGNYGNKALGVHATKEINAYGRRLQKDWLLTTAHASYQDANEDNDIVTSKPNLQLIRSTGYIDELISWNADGNFDRVSAMNMVMILREEKKKYIDNIKQNNSPAKDAVNSDYFSKNYDNRWNKTYSHKELEEHTRKYFPVK